MRALSEQMITRSQQAFADAEIQLTRMEAIGGDVWDISRPGGGDGINEPVGDDMPMGSATVYVTRVSASLLERALAGDRIEVEQWRFVAPESERAADALSDGIWEGRTIRSQDDPNLIFRIESLDTRSGYLAGTLQREL